MQSGWNQGPGTGGFPGQSNFGQQFNPYAQQQQQPGNNPFAGGAQQN